MPDDGNMELTEQINPKLVQQAQQFNEKQAATEDVDICSIPCKSNAKRQTIHFKQMLDDGNMELTGQINPKLVQQNKWLNEKQTVAEDDICSIPYKSNAKLQTIHFKQTSDESNMELTEQINNNLMEQVIVTRTLDICSILTKSQSKHATQSSDNSVTNGCNVELIEQVNYNMVAHNSFKQNKELEDFPSFPTKCQTLHFNPILDDKNVNLTDCLKSDLTEQAKHLSDEKLEELNVVVLNEPLTDSRNCILPSNKKKLELTNQLIPNVIEQNTKELKKSTVYKSQTKPQALHFESPDKSNMEMIEQINSDMVEKAKYLINKNEISDPLLKFTRLESNNETLSCFNSIQNISKVKCVSQDESMISSRNNLSSGISDQFPSLKIIKKCELGEPEKINEYDELRSINNITHDKSKLKTMKDINIHKDQSEVICLNSMTKPIFNATNSEIALCNLTLPQNETKQFICNHSDISFHNEICQRIPIAGQEDPWATMDEFQFESISKSFRNNMLLPNSINLSYNNTTYTDNTQHFINYKLPLKLEDSHNLNTSLVDAIPTEKLCNEIDFDQNKKYCKDREDEREKSNDSEQKCRRKSMENIDDMCRISRKKKFEDLIQQNIIEINSSSELSMIESCNKSEENKLMKSPCENNSPKLDGSLQLFKLVHEKSLCWTSALPSDDLSLISTGVVSINSSTSDLEKDADHDVEPAELKLNNNFTFNDLITTINVNLDECVESLKNLIDNILTKPIIDEESRKQKIHAIMEEYYELEKKKFTLDRPHKTQEEMKPQTFCEAICEKCKDTTIEFVHEDFKFNVLYGSISIFVNYDRNTDIVNEIKYNSNICDDSDPSAIYVHNLFYKKLSNLEAALGLNYSIFMLLDYLILLDEQMYDILTELEDLEEKYGLILNSDLNASFIIANVARKIAFKVTLNLQRLDNISIDCISIKNYVGTIQEKEIKKIALGCPSGIACLRSYIECLHMYLEQQTNRSAC